MRKFDLSLRSSRSSYFATFRHQLTILSKTDALDEEKWLNMLGTFVKDWFRYESHFVHGRDSLVDILKERGLLSIQRNQSAAFSSGKVRPNHETNINIIARRTGKDVNSHTVLDGIITTIMATIQRINIIGSREGSRNRRRLKANQTGKKFRVGIKSNISTNRNNLISGVDRCIHLNAMKKTTITSTNRQTIKI